MTVSADSHLTYERAIGTQLARRRIGGYGRGELLTDGESAVVQAILSGHTTCKDIANHLRLKVGTVRTYMSLIYAKTRARNMAELVLMKTGRVQCDIDLGPY